MPPLVDVALKELVAKCQLAPYGHGEKTLVDTELRNTWELSVGQFELTNPAWNSFVRDEILSVIRVPLGIDKSIAVEAKLYKMLLYEAGGKFEKHQDSEKENGMFGTLVIVLPGRFEGGELLVHDPSTAQDPSSIASGDVSSSSSPDVTKSHVWDPASMDPFAIKFAAFYGDCPHEVKPVTKGYRLCLTYNLVNVGESGSVPRFGANHPLYATLKGALCEFFTDDQASRAKRQRVDEEGTKLACGFEITKPETHRLCKLVYVLNHQYTDAGLSFEYLKNKDALVADCLARFCDESKGAFELYLSKIEYKFEWRGPESSCYISEDEKLREYEHVDKKLNLFSPWVARGDREQRIKVAAERSYEKLTGDLISEVAPTGKFDRKSFKFDGKDEQLSTGNEGASLTKWYKSAALLIVPLAVAMTVQMHASPKAAFKRWVSLVETDPDRARAMASGFENALNKKWSLTSKTGVKVLAAARQLNDLGVIRCVLTSGSDLEFLPQLREIVAPFSTEAVAALAKSVCGSNNRAPFELLNDHVNLIASLLDGVKDPVIIKPVLDAVAIDATKSGTCRVTEYARVLLLASRVSVDHAKLLLFETDVNFFVQGPAQATRIMVTSCGADDWDAVRDVVSYTIEQLTASEPAIKQLAQGRENLVLSLSTLVPVRDAQPVLVQQRHGVDGDEWEDGRTLEDETAWETDQDGTDGGQLHFCHKDVRVGADDQGAQGAGRVAGGADEPHVVRRRHSVRRSY